MCGLFGVLQLGTSVSRQAIVAGRDAQAHRGPDDCGLWQSIARGGSTIALAHRRLSILDLSERGTQPLLITRDGRARPAGKRDEESARFALIYNGEIYNYIELRDELKKLGYSFSSSSDTEVLLRAYEHWGSKCLDRLNGMFAVAIWDAEREELFCARDRFGEKPFHYILDEARGIFALSSEIKGFVSSGITWPEFDERAVYRYLKFGEQAGAVQTIWQDVRRLPPAHQMRISVRGGRLACEVSRYWNIDLTASSSLKRDAQVAQFHELFRESVAMRLRADVRVGTGLSGGIDSSSVVCAIGELGTVSAQHTFTAMMDDPLLDESKYARLVARAADAEMHIITPSAEVLLDELDPLFLAQEEPFPSTSMFASYLISRLARDHGVVVLLDGQGADEFLAGYAHYPALILSQLARRGRVVEWWLERQAVRARLSIDPVPPKAALQYFFGRNNGGGAALLVDGDTSPSYLQNEFATRFADEQARTIAIDGSPLRTRLYADLMLGHLQELLRYADRNSMHFSREVRLPFLDHRLVELCLSLPESSLFHRGESKIVLRRAMRGVVPNVILNRRDKIGFATPWSQWWQGESRPELGQILRDSEAQLSDFIAPGRVAEGTADALSVIGLARARCMLRSLWT